MSALTDRLRDTLAAQGEPIAKPTCTRPVKRGFGALPCPRCAEVCSIALTLDAFDEDYSLKCAECEEEFTVAEIRDLVEKWSRVLAWLDTAPLLPE